jgi:hypothetical protein
VSLSLVLGVQNNAGDFVVLLTYLLTYMAWV